MIKVFKRIRNQQIATQISNKYDIVFKQSSDDNAFFFNIRRRKNKNVRYLEKKTRSKFNHLLLPIAK